MGKNIRTIYNEGQERLAAGGVHDAAFDARALLSFVLGIPFREIPLHYMDDVTDEEKEQFDVLIRRRIGGEPLQYITGEQEFMGLSFHVDNRVLIPRLDTEILAERAINYVDKLLASAECADGQPPVRVLDLCCGSGAIGLSIAALANGGHSASQMMDAPLADGGHSASQIGDKAAVSTDAGRIKVTTADAARTEATAADAARVDVVLADISADALEVARQNAETLEVFDRVRLVRSDLFGGLAGQEGFDLIVSNPPYIRTDVIATLDEEVRGHEPMLALDGGADGLDIYRRIAGEAPDFLKAGGCLMMEIGCDQAKDVAALLEEGFDDVEVVKDLAGLDRVVVAKGRVDFSQK